MDPYIELFRIVAKPVFFLIMGISAVAGVIALISPSLFKRTAAVSGRIVDTKKILEVLDKRVDIDHFVFAHSRLLGAVVLAAVVTLVYMYCNHDISVSP
ncbi:MAG: hypothetical protein IIA67_13710 [Planctomycetes bacterium]|nr:hypothetical protein [Planctomycetota bacterium]